MKPDTAACVDAVTGVNAEREGVRERIEIMRAAVEAMQRKEYFKRWVNAVNAPSLRVQYSKRSPYAKVISCPADCAVGFVDLATGDILYPASWSRPCKGGPRGNVFAEDSGLSAWDEYGVRNARG